MIDRKRLDERLRQQAGHEDLEAFLERVRLEFRAIEGSLWAHANLDRSPGADEVTYRRLRGRAGEASRLAERLRALASQHTKGARRRARRKTRARSGALLARLEDTREVLAALVATYPEALAWIRDVLRKRLTCISRAGR